LKFGRVAFINILRGKFGPISNCQYFFHVLRTFGIDLPPKNVHPSFGKMAEKESFCKLIPNGLKREKKHEAGDCRSTEFTRREYYAEFHQITSINVVWVHKMVLCEILTTNVNRID